MKTPYFMKYFMKSGLLYELNVNPRFLNETNHESGGQFHIFHLGALRARNKHIENIRGRVSKPTKERRSEH